ncbi:MAG: ABC transporter permease/M1 family aminopeptidase [bacterium]
MNAAILRVAGAELSMQTRRFAFWFFSVLFVAIGIMFFTRFMAVSAGEDSMTQGVRLARNSAYSLSILHAALALFFSHFTASLSMDPVLRDRRLGILPMVLSSPLSERDYVLGKFLGALAACLAAPLFFVVSGGIAQFVPNNSVGLIAPNLTAFLVGYLEFCVPFTILISAVSFSLATRTGNTKLVYAVVTVFMISYLVLLNAIESIDNRWLATLDPSGLLWLAEVAGKGKTNAEQNALGWMMDLGFLVNRIVVIGGALVVVVLTALRFARWHALTGQGDGGGARKRRAAAPAPAAIAPALTTLAGGLAPLPATFRLETGHAVQFGRVLSTEFRLLMQERALFFLPLLLAFILFTSVEARTGIFDAEMIPVSSEVIRQSFGIFLLFLFGTTTFFVGESAFRERDTGISDMLHALPVPEAAIVFGKAVANIAVSLAFMSVAFVTLSIYQLANRGGAIDVAPYLYFYGLNLFPTVLFMTALSLFLASVARSKHAGYAIFLGIAGILTWAFVRGHGHWLYNIPALSLFRYSDIDGLGPLWKSIVTQRAYVAALSLVLLCAAAGLYPRTPLPLRQAFTSRQWHGRRMLVPAAFFTVVAVVLGGSLFFWVENGGVGSLATERGRVDYEKKVRPWLLDLPQPEIAGVDIDLDLFPERNAFRISGTMLLKNSENAPLDSVHITVNPRLFEKGKMTLAGRAADRFEHAIATFRLGEPLAPGAELPLVFQWEGRVPDGVPRHSTGMQTFIGSGGTFLHSFASMAWLPAIGYQADVEIESDRTRRKYKLGERESLPDDDGTGPTKGFGHQTSAFPYHAKIRTNSADRVLSAGRLIAERSLGARREFEYQSDAPLYFFPVMAGRWLDKGRDACAVYYDAAHPQNVDKILDALAGSRAFFSEAFSPYPYADLRLAEFPSHGSFAMGYPTLIPFSESIGFLTRDTENLPNLNFYVTAHEVAHQWWGTVVWPAHAKGSPVLTEGLANYSTLIFAQRVEGDRKRQKLFELFEDLYLRRRDPNEERPIAQADGDRRGDDAIWYNRGGVVFYMLHFMLGEEKMLAGLQEFIRRFSFQNDHPTITDFAGVYQELYPETKPFFDQFVFDKVIPNPKFTIAKSESLADGRWRVAFEIANQGAGDLDLVVEAHEGKRADRDKAEREAANARAKVEARGGRVDTPGDSLALLADGAVAADAARHFASARTRVALVGAGPVTGEILCDFKPTEIEIDPDATVLLQERRKGRSDL